MSLTLVESALDGKYKNFNKEFNRTMSEKSMEAIERVKADILGNSLVEGEEIVESHDDLDDSIKINIASVENVDEAVNALSRLGVDAELDEEENLIYVENTEDNKELCEAWAGRFEAQLV